MGFGWAKQQVPSPWGENQFKHSFVPQTHPPMCLWSGPPQTPPPPLETHFYEGWVGRGGVKYVLK